MYVVKKWGNRLIIEGQCCMMLDTVLLHLMTVENLIITVEKNC